MKITAITKLKHGGLWAAIKKLGWPQKRLARECGMSEQEMGRILNLQDRPTVKKATRIQLALAQHDIYFDPTVEWPEAFCGTKMRITLENTKDFTAKELEAAHLYYQQLLLPENAEAEEEECLRLELVDACICDLPECQRAVIDMRYGLTSRSPVTLDGCAAAIGCSRERVRQIEIKALKNIRKKSKIELNGLKKEMGRAC